MPHYELSDIFQEFLESDLFTDILDTLQYCFNDSLVVDYIKTFPKIKRFSTLVLFLSEKEKTCKYRFGIDSIAGHPLQFIPLTGTQFFPATI